MTRGVPKIREEVRALRNGATVCGWCAEFEARAQQAESLVQDAIGALEDIALTRRLNDSHGRGFRMHTLGHQWRCTCSSCIDAGCQCAGCAAGRRAELLKLALRPVHKATHGD